MVKERKKIRELHQIKYHFFKKLIKAIKRVEIKLKFLKFLYEKIGYVADFFSPFLVHYYTIPNKIRERKHIDYCIFSLILLYQ